MLDREKIKELREGLGWTQAVLAAHWSDAHGSTVSARVVSTVEAGYYTPSLDRVAALAAVLGVGLSDLVIARKAHKGEGAK